MLLHLRSLVVETLASVDEAMLSTFGPAGLQAARVTCAAHELMFYVLLPLTSDLLFNIESHASVVVSTPTWQMHGSARVLDAAQWPRSARLPVSAEDGWRALAEICPTRLQIFSGPNGPETIDIDGESAGASS